MSTLKCVTLLLLPLLFQNLEAFGGPTSYVIGSQFNLTWEANFSTSQTVNISLSYSNNQNLFLVEVNNTGSVTLLTPDFGYDPSHLLVPNGVSGQWMISANGGSQLLNNVTINQPLMVNVTGGVVDLGTSFEIDVIWGNSMNFSTAIFTCALVYLNDQGSWVAPYMFNVTSNSRRRSFRSTALTLTLSPDTSLTRTLNYYLVVFANLSGISYSGINGATSFSDWDRLFIPYDSSKIMISLESYSLAPYSSAPMNITVGNELNQSYIYIGLSDNLLNDTDMSQLQCNSSMASQYNQFGWLLEETNMTMYGNYTMELFYNPMTNFDNVVSLGSSYRLYSDNRMIEILQNETEIYSIVLDRSDYMDDNDSVTIKKGQQINFHIVSIAYNTPVTVYAEWVQYDYDKNELVRLENQSISITQKIVSQQNDKRFQSKVPKSAEISDAVNKSITLRLFGTDCQGQMFGLSEYMFTLKKKKNSTDKLSAGAIVGIVCAGVLICGLAAWYLAMSRHTNSNSGYSELDKD